MKGMAEMLVRYWGESKDTSIAMQKGAMENTNRDSFNSERPTGSERMEHEDIKNIRYEICCGSPWLSQLMPGSENQVSSLRLARPRLAPRFLELLAGKTVAHGETGPLESSGVVCWMDQHCHGCSSRVCYR